MKDYVAIEEKDGSPNFSFPECDSQIKPDLLHSSAASEFLGIWVLLKDEGRGLGKLNVSETHFHCKCFFLHCLLSGKILKRQA